MRTSELVRPTGPATLDLLGSARKVVVTKDDTTLVEGAGTEDEPQPPLGHRLGASGQQRRQPGDEQAQSEHQAGAADVDQRAAARPAHASLVARSATIVSTRPRCSRSSART